ncbi:putative transporter like protein [Verticillium longisporum]|nr:putative transporter like protein [Verticillium longisporum]
MSVMVRQSLRMSQAVAADLEPKGLPAPAHNPDGCPHAVYHAFPKADHLEVIVPASFFGWTAEEEKKLVKKIDWRILLWAWVMFVALDLHRKNINRAISDNMLPELGMDTNDFNYGQTDDKLGSSPADSITDEENRPARKGHYGSTEDHVFSDPSVADYWRKVYEQAGYENRHRFDPTLEWTAEEERKLVKKIDWRILLWAWIMFVALDLHRKNINRAISDNMVRTIQLIEQNRANAA